MDTTWKPNRRKRSANPPGLIESSDSECEEMTDAGDTSTKMRVGTAACHKEYEKTKVPETGRFQRKCKHCPTTYNHSNCTGLMQHLKAKHPDIYQKCREEDTKNREEKMNKKKAEVTIKKGETSKGHQTARQAYFGNKTAGPMDNFLKKKTNDPLPNKKQELIEQKFTFWLGASGIPISAVTEDPNFLDFVYEINDQVTRA